MPITNQYAKYKEKVKNRIKINEYITILTHTFNARVIIPTTQLFEILYTHFKHSRFRVYQREQ